MARNATVYSFDISLNDSDRGVYERLSFRIARHPSETAEYLLTRVLAYCLEYEAGLEFTAGLSDPDVPALALRDLTGALRGWIEIGTPEPARLHRAAKAAAKVAVYSHKDLAPLLARLAAEPVYRASQIAFHALGRDFIGALAASLERRMVFDLTVSEGMLYLTLGEQTLSGAVTPYRVG
jgi:uncharacterized protein YaeQ